MRVGCLSLSQGCVIFGRAPPVTWGSLTVWLSLLDERSDRRFLLVHRPLQRPSFFADIINTSLHSCLHLPTSPCPDVLYVHRELGRPASERLMMRLSGVFRRGADWTWDAAAAAVVIPARGKEKAVKRLGSHSSTLVPPGLEIMTLSPDSERKLKARWKRICSAVNPGSF